jgi:hypothetical protein
LYCVELLGESQQAQELGAFTLTSEPFSLCLQTLDLNNVPGGCSQKRGNNESISMSLLFPAFNFQEYFC